MPAASMVAGRRPSRYHVLRRLPVAAAPVAMIAVASAVTFALSPSLSYRGVHRVPGYHHHPMCTGCGFEAGRIPSQLPSPTSMSALYDDDDPFDPTRDDYAVWNTPPTRERRRHGTKRRRRELFELEPEPPSDDPEVLYTQLYATKVLPVFLRFLEKALESPAFGVRQFLKSLDVLSKQRQSGQARGRKELASLKGSPTMQRLADLGVGLLDTNEDLDPALVVSSLRCVAMYKDQAPQLLSLAEPLASHAARLLPEIKSEQICDLMYCVSELLALVPQLQDELLLAIVQDPRGLKWKMSRHYKALFRNAVFKMKKDFPYLREVLPPVL